MSNAGEGSRVDVKCRLNFPTALSFSRKGGTVILPPVSAAQASALWGRHGLCVFGGYCVETAVALGGRVVRNAYGPFSSDLVEKCIQSGGGAPCLTQRWDADFLLTLL